MQRIRRKGDTFKIECFFPKHEWKFAGKVMWNNSKEAFVTHFKQPDKHFYIKGLGYPVNEELLCMLRNAGIKYIIIPEKGKRDFKAYLGSITDYLHGELISEPKTEAQRSMPLKNLEEIPLGEDTLRRFLYG